MKRTNLTLTLALAAVGLMTSAPVLAASTTHSLAVSSTVVGNCKFNAAGPTTLTIANSAGSIDPSVAVDATGTASMTYRCTTGTVAATAAGNGLHFAGGTRQVNDGGTNNMPYSVGLSGCAGTGLGYGAGGDLTCSVTGTILQAGFVSAPAGTYTDTVVLTITP